MSSNVLTPSISKNLPQVASPSYSQGPIASASDTSQRRSASSSSYGTTGQTRNSPQARGNQSLRKQHKAQRRARLVDEDALAESAAMKSVNSRRGQTSITHLMNFSLPPRPSLQQHHMSNHRQQRRNPTWGLGSGYHAIDKARYVHANYRFIVRPDREYRAQAVDADVHVAWDAVLQVMASAETQAANCPICLSIPVAPRMAKCGHVSCLPCLIRYMHSTDDANPLPEKRARWKKCPICEDSIYISETRPVRWFTGQEASMLREGGDVLLRLLMREPGTTLALPRDTAGTYVDRDDIPWFNVVEMMDYARFMKGGEEYMLSQYNAEIDELEAQEKEDELMFGDDTTWTKKAVAAITDAKEKIKGIGDPPTTRAQPELKARHEPLVFNESDEAPELYSLQKATKSGRSLADVRGPEPLEHLVHATNRLSITSEERTAFYPTPRGHAGTSRPPSHPYFFYNALPNFFLSALDIRILKAAYGDFSLFPSTLLPRIEHISTGHVVDEDLRKRAKYMAHLPFGCEVSFLECDWTDIINPAVLELFTEDIARRRKRNHEKEAREERERVRAEKEEDDKRWAAARRRRPSPIAKSFSETDFRPLMSGDAVLAGSSDAPHLMSSTPPWGNARAHSSFATLASPGTSPEAPRTVWGTAAVPYSSPPLVATTHDNVVPDDGWLQGWEKDLLDQDDALAMVEASLNGEGSSKSPAILNHGKKKKKQKITLMSTNARRGA